MNKICTSIEQSNKLIKLGFDKSTADMHYFSDGYNPIKLDVGYDRDNAKFYRGTENKYIPAWSLSALLELIPNYQMQTQNNGIGILYGCKEEIKIIERETPIDAAFEMVCWLKENNKI